MKNLTLLICVSLAYLAAEAAEKEKVERKIVTLISAEGKADGSTEISREAVKECIVSLPSADAIEPEIVSEARFLREINGEAGKSGWTKVYTARIVVQYMVYKKDLLIVATRSVEGKEPAFREIEKRLPQSKEFTSNPAEGDTFAGRSNREFYFTKAEDAVKDAKLRARVWLKQQAPLLCTDK